MEDGEVIQNASFGLALCGIRIDGVKGSRQLRPVKQILQCPTKCQLRGPIEEHRQLRLEFSSEEKIVQFLDAAAESGWTAALNLFSLVNTHIDHSSSQSTSSVLDARAAERCSVEICYAPTRSFRIEQQQMQLSEEAVADLRGVHTLSQAKEFLNQYHSHVSTGVFHLGAVYTEWTTSGKWAQKSSLTTKRLAELTGGVGINNPKAHIKAGIGFHTERQAAARERVSKTEDTKSCITLALGGPTGAITNSKAFIKSVETTPSYWAIISSTCTSQTLVAVWDLVLKTCEESLWKPAELLCAAWQSTVAGSAHVDDDVFKLHQASLTKAAVSTPTEGGHDNLAEASLPSRAQSQTEFPNSGKIIRQEVTSSFRILDSRILWLRPDDEDNPCTGDTDMLSNSESVEDMNEGKKKQSAPLAEPKTPSLEAAMGQQQSDHTAFGPNVNEVLQTTQQPAAHAQLITKEEISSDTQQTHPQFTYINDFLTHGPFPQPHKYRNLIDRISHALPPFENFKHQLANEDEFWDAHPDAHTKPLSSRIWDRVKSPIWTTFGGTVKDVGGNCHSSQDQDPVIEESEAAKSIVYIYENSDFLGQITLLRLLLDQRWGVPLVFSSLSTKNSLSKKLPCFHTIEALNYVLTKIGAHSSAHDLVLATDMPRVVFLSNHCNREHERMAEQVTKFRFLPFPYGAEDRALYIQFGIGFLPENKKTPYLAVVVSGAYSTEEQCIKFLNEIADVLFLQVRHHDMGNNVTTIFPSLTCKTMLRWAIDSSGVSGMNPAAKEIWGSSIDVAIKLTRFLNTKWSRPSNTKQQGRRHLRSICTTYFEVAKSDLNNQDPKGLEDTLKQTEFGTLRKKLVLQSSFLCEATARFESLKLKHNNEQKQKKLRECNNEIKKREQDAGKVAEIPIIQIFLKVLQLKESSSRCIGILKLKNSMQERSHRALLEWSEKVDVAFKRFQNTPTQESKKDYNNYRDEHAGKVIGLEHLWREVSHIFLTNPRGHIELPKLAARHLLDGFPLEILDGDAKFFNDVWVKAILLETQQLLMEEHAHSGSPRILVLSILGTQSSGKTTLLNIMFGTNLPTKAGRCTSGVHIQLIKSQWCEYDYILLMDTEGIKGPEHYGEQQYLSHDNRMATFAILPSDACIMVVAGEDDSNLKDVLPLVLLAFKGSTAAQKSGGRLRSKMLFVYRSVDINEQDELRTNQQTLLEYLVDAERHITRPAHDTNVEVHNVTGGGHALGSAGALLDFHVDDKEDFSDVKFLGNYKRDSTPPEDIPDSKYGEKVLQLRDYMHKRVTEDPKWTPFDFKELGSYMDLVWSCILRADFELSFKSSVEYGSYMDLQQMLQLPRTLVSRSYVEELEEMETVDNSHHNDTSLEWLQFCKVQETISEQTKRVEEILENSRWLILWKAEEGQKWKDFLEQQDRWFKMQLRDHKTGVILFEKLVIESDKRLQQAILALRGLPDDKQISFDTMFSNFLENAKKSYKPLADGVREQVNRVYTRHKSILESFGHGEDPEGDSFFEEKSFTDLKERLLEPSLKNARQYSDDLVEGAINLTSAFIKKHPIAYDEKRQRQGQTHAKVKEFVTLELRKTQQKWDEEHNPAARLEKQRDRFHHLYTIHTNGCDMANLLLEELKSVFTESLETTLQQSIAKQSSSSLQRESWLFNWKVMRGLLDALLLKLLEDGKDDHVLDYVSEGGLYHQHVLENLIKINLGKIAKTSLHDLRSKVKNAVSCASNKAVAVGADATAVFRDNLIEKLASQMPASRKICEALRRISPDASTADKDRGLGFRNILTPELHQTVDKICEAVEKQLDTPTGLRNIADMVKKRLILHGNPSYRTRCEEACPRCGVTCFLPARHVTCHDTMHQPQGLKGKVWESGQLSEKTCTEHYRDHDWFTVQGSTKEQVSKNINYRAFNKAYPNWENPSIDHELKYPLTCKVRQCLFFHCQSQLVKRYPTTQQNHNCAHFAHSIPRLRFEIEQDLPVDDDLLTVIDILAKEL